MDYPTDGSNTVNLLNGIASAKGSSSVAYENLALAPVYMVRAGTVSLQMAALRTAGSGGRFWSSTPLDFEGHAFLSVILGKRFIPAANTTTYDAVSM